MVMFRYYSFIFGVLFLFGVYMNQAKEYIISAFCYCGVYPSGGCLKEKTTSWFMSLIESYIQI